MSKQEKCEFNFSSVSFLGYIVEKGQVRADPAKVEAVREWPVPTTRNHLQRFVGFANFYRRFIRDYSRIATPLSQLTSSKVTFTWFPGANAAFEKLKMKFTNAPVLIHPGPEQPFGAVLSQRLPEDNKLHPCAFFSRGSPQPRETTTWGTVNCWRWYWPCRSGDTGWRGQLNRL